MTGIKRSRTSGPPFSGRHNTQTKLQRNDYTVGWICAIPVEMTAATAILDSFHGETERDPSDENTYVLGAICGHNVVIVCLPHGQYGTNSAAVVAKDMLRSFPSIKIGLMVGIGGGVPRTSDIRLGDIVVSDRVVQYDFGKTGHDGKITPTGTLNKPPRPLLAAVSSLQARHQRDSSEIPKILAEMLERYPAMTNYIYQGADHDRLFEPSYEHTAASCDRCDNSKIVKRTPRPDSNPKIHYGVIASGNQVMRDAQTRDRLAQEHNILCFEMEAAGLMDAFPCLVIRGICDYSDSHKAKQWQEYAAATAAAYAKELLSTLPGNSMSMSTPCKDKTLVVDRRRELLESLRFDQIGSRQSTIKTAFGDTCQWLSNHSGYLSWRDLEHLPDHHGFLWISGKPGTGKSTIMKYISERSKEEIGKTNVNAAVISFFFNARGDEFEKTTIGMYRSLLYQLVWKLPDMTDAIEDLVAKSTARDNNYIWTLDILKRAFSKSVELLGHRQVTCFIDALDECEEDEVREMVRFFEDIGRGAVSSGTKFHICFSSRHYPHITLDRGIRLVLEDQHEHERDLEEYVRSRLNTRDEERTEDLTAQILRKASGVFMWVVLVVDILNKEIDRGRMLFLESKLNELPTKLSDLFRDILTRDKENMDELLLSIQWILFSKRPLKPEEYFFAMAAGLKSDCLEEWDHEEITLSDMDRFVVSSSKGLAESTKSVNATVQFIHESVRDFLLKDYGLESLWPELGADRDRHSHETLKQCCYTYINLDFYPYIKSCEIPSTIGNRDKFALETSHKFAKYLQSVIAQKFPFLEYATTHVLHHANIASSWVPQNDFIRSFSTKQWIKLYNIFGAHKSYGYTLNASRLYIFAEQGLVSLVQTILRENRRFDVSRERNRCIFQAAVRGGNEAVLQALLNHIGRQKNQQGAISDFSSGSSDMEESCRVELPDESGRTLLSIAAEHGHISIAKLLIDKGANVNARDKHGRTPLWWAVMYKQEDFVEFLASAVQILDDCLENSDSSEDEEFGAMDQGYSRLVAEIDIYDKKGDTPLICAVQNGHEHIARTLLLAGADIHASTRNGQTPLHRAVASRSESLTKLLIEKGADVHRKDKSGQMPIHISTLCGSRRMTKTLIQAGADVNCSNGAGETPLILAYSSSKVKGTTSAELRHNIRLRPPISTTGGGRGYELIILLLDHGAELDKRNTLGRTILFEACARADFKFAELLIQKGADVTIADNNGQRPFSATLDPTQFPNTLTKLLLEKGANIKDRDSFARDFLRIGLSRYARDKVFFDSAWPNVEGPVREAILNGVDVDIRDPAGRTMLLKAVRAGYKTLVSFLLETGANPDFLDRKSANTLAGLFKKGVVMPTNPNPSKFWQRLHKH
ncbi:uncharacterized protein CTRU02_206142 [Colletotrichum truncatum]|uniref:Uncharacterized protein n=1 Tax=Colletotrichum truncatum TaxID=5467 RepID=A0ACC3Z605_COLTU